MSDWMVTCPRCGTTNAIEKNQVEIECGNVRCACICANCQNQFEAVDEYWRWLGLEENPQGELTDR